MSPDISEVVLSGLTPEERLRVILEDILSPYGVMVKGVVPNTVMGAAFRIDLTDGKTSVFAQMDEVGGHREVLEYVAEWTLRFDNDLFRALARARVDARRQLSREGA